MKARAVHHVLPGNARTECNIPVTPQLVITGTIKYATCHNCKREFEDNLYHHNRPEYERQRRAGNLAEGTGSHNPQAEDRATVEGSGE